MHTLLLAAALAVGSGDGRDGATDGRTVEKVPSYTLLRVGMSYEELERLMGKPQVILGSMRRLFKQYRVGPDWFGRCQVVTVDLSVNGHVTDIRVHEVR
jgi:hypothetical protein